MQERAKVDLIVVPIVLVALFAVLLCLVLKWKKNKSGNRVIGNVIVYSFCFFCLS